MNKITELNFNNTYSTLPQEFYHIIDPKPFNRPFIVSFNPEVSKLIGLEPDEFQNKDIANYLCGKKTIPGSDPIAMYYTGHQFGAYNPHLGDGRAILLGEVEGKDGEKWDLHLKGAGRTSYSRQFDGRAVLRSTIREYLCSEAMHYLGIPTTRSLCIIGSDEEVERETTEMGAMMIRVAKSHVRFGSFEGFYYRGEHDHLKTLLDYVIEKNFLHLKDEPDRYRLFIREVVEETADLIAKWQAFGFTHGVMNTDNMSIIGDTLDYGPFGFMDEFSFEYVPNHSDHFGRYSYENQPPIAYWNLNKLCQCLSPLIPNKDLTEALDMFGKVYRVNYLELMAKKFGFTQFFDSDKKFIESTLKLTEEQKQDYTIFFRNLSDFKTNDHESENTYLNDLCETDVLRGWFENYRLRLRRENSDDTRRKEQMDSINPKYIFRNYIAEQTIRKAEDEGDYSEIDKVRKLLMNPFNVQEGMEEYAKPAPDWAKNLIVSCSS